MATLVLTDPLDALAGYDPNDPVTAASVGHVPATYTSFLIPDGLKGMRLGVIGEPMASDTDPESGDFRQVRGVIDRALADMTACAAEIVDPVSIPALKDLLGRTSGSFETEEAINGYLAVYPRAPVKTLQEIVLSADVLLFHRSRLMRALGRTTDDPGYLQQLQVRNAPAAGGLQGDG